MELLNPLTGTQFAAQTTTYTDTAGTVTGWPAGPQGVVVWSDTACYVLVGDDVTATIANGTPLPANMPVPFKVPAGSGGTWRVSAVQIAVAGNLYCKPINIQ